MKLTALIIIFTLLSSCESSDSSSESELVTVWITESCEQTSFANGAVSDGWSKALYEFTDREEILFGSNQYNDSNCQTLIETVSPIEITGVLIEYLDNGQVTLEEGIDGNSLQIRIESDSKDLTRRAFYTINSGVLCFSEAFNFDVTSFEVTESGLDTIDFSSCLTKL